MKYLYLLLILGLTSCGTIPVVEVVPIQPIHPNLPPAVRLSPVEWKVITTTNDTYFALTAKNYENLSKNLEFLSEYIQNLRLIINTYRTNNFGVQTNSAKIDKEDDKLRKTQKVRKNPFSGIFSSNYSTPTSLEDLLSSREYNSPIPATITAVETAH